MTNTFNHAVDQGVVATLTRVRSRIDYALEEYKKKELPLGRVELNLRQSIEALRQVRKIILNSGDY